MRFPIVIEQATAADIAELAELSVTTFVDAFGPVNKPEDIAMYVATELSSHKLAAEVADARNAFFMARLDGKAIGYIKLRDNETPEELRPARCLEIERIYVLQAYHSYKVGSMLMQYAHDRAIAQNYDELWLGVWEHNNRAITFYQRWGFTLFGSHGFLLGTDDQTDVLMRKPLTPKGEL